MSVQMESLSLDSTFCGSTNQCHLCFLRFCVINRIEKSAFCQCVGFCLFLCLDYHLHRKTGEGTRVSL